MAESLSTPSQAEAPGTPETGSRFGFWASLLCRRVLTHARVDPGAIDHIRSLSQRGSIVYVMRYRSLVDYLLVASILLREGLPLPEFVSDVPVLLLRPMRDIFRTMWRRTYTLRHGGRAIRHFEDRDRCQRLVAHGSPVLIFMRGRAPHVPLSARRRSTLHRARFGIDHLREIVHANWAGNREVFLVPIAIMRGRGFRRKEGRLATLVYSVQEAPGEIKRLSSLIWHARETSISVGKHLELGEFTRNYSQEGEERIVRRLARTLQIFLHREERAVWGPTLLPKRTVRQLVLAGSDLSSMIHRLAVETNQPESHLWRRAERYFDEMAANFHGAYFGILEWIFNRLWQRVFAGLEYTGLERVVEVMKQHPIVLVPCHRSHFDYLILSYLFHIKYLSPPHIAAGINLSFWPLGPLFRGAGAYFIRRTFEGNDLYKMVFRKYLTFLIREGYTQEFFIEGGRSRTGKILTPKLGMLSALVNTFLEGARRDLYFVPISISYDRILEEDAYKRELTGGEKEKESLSALIRARTVLRQKYGKVYINFAEPISLSEALGAQREQFLSNEPAAQQAKRHFIRKLSFRILRDVNAASVAGASALSATVLLSSPHSAWRYDAFVTAARTLVGLLRHLGVNFTDSLARDTEEFRENLAFLHSAGLIQRTPEEPDIIVVPADKRINLDFYKNNTLHFFLIPALLSRALQAGISRLALEAEIGWWLSLYSWEFALPERNAVAAEIGNLLDYFRTQGVVAPTNDEAVHLEHPLLSATAGLLDNFCEAYLLTARGVAQLDAHGVPHKAFLEATRKRYATGLLLGEVRRPEGNSRVIVENALNHFAELQLITVATGAKPKERVIQPGPGFQETGGLVARLEANLRQG